MAGILNLHAEQAIRLPEAQDIGKVELNFIRVSPRAPQWKRAIILLAPVILGMVIIWVISTNVFDTNTFFASIGGGTLAEVGDGIVALTNTSDFWLWFYLVFTISNTMFPDVPKDLRRWWLLGSISTLVIASLLLFAIQGQVLNAEAVPIASLLEELNGILLLLIGFDIAVTLILGTVESIVERVGKYEATFKGDKLITMTHEEAQAMREKNRKRSNRRPRTKVVYRSIYDAPFPIPGNPDQEPLTKTATNVLPVASQDQSPFLKPEREKPDLITTGSERPSTDSVTRLPRSSTVGQSSSVQQLQSQASLAGMARMNTTNALQQVRSELLAIIAMRAEMKSKEVRYEPVESVDDWIHDEDYDYGDA